MSTTPTTNGSGSDPDASFQPSLQQQAPVSSGDTIPAADDPHVSAVQLKLPPYWATDPQIWFAQVEAYFSTRRITSQLTKFQVVVHSLEPRYACEVRELILHPPASDPYDKLRDALVSRTQKSEQARLRELLSNEELGDQPPSRLLRRMQQLLGDRNMDDTLLRELFVQRMPPSVRLVLASAPGSISLSELAQLADKVVESTAPLPVHTVVPPPASDIVTLRDELAKLTAAVNARTTDGTDRQGRSRGRSPTPMRRRISSFRSPGRDTHDDSDVCWYHRKFGLKAKRCREPCSFDTSGNGSASH